MTFPKMRSEHQPSFFYLAVEVYHQCISCVISWNIPNLLFHQKSELLSFDSFKCPDA